LKFLLIKFLKFILFPFKGIISSISKEYSEKKLFNTGLILSKQNNLRFKKIKNLSEVEFSVFSQWGDDGIIDWLNHILNFKNKRFVEIGVEDYHECNTRFILKKNNWSGLVLDMSKKYIDKIKSQSVYWKHNLTAKKAYVTAENINQILTELDYNKNISLLSLDIDGNDFWVMKKLKINADLIICEFNGIFGDIHEITVPYKKNFNRTKEHHSNLYYGCSIKSLISLLSKKKYFFIGTNSGGNNAYFINATHFQKIKKRIREFKIFSPKFRESRNKKFEKTFLPLNKGVDLIKEKNVYDLKKKKLVKIKDFIKMYSRNFLSS
jgi:hypothetical protein